MMQRYIKYLKKPKKLVSFFIKILGANKNGFKINIKKLERFLSLKFLCKLLIFNDLSELVNAPMYKTIYPHVAVVPIVHHLLRITCHNTLYWCEVEWVIHCRSQLHWHIWCIDVTCVKK